MIELFNPKRAAYASIRGYLYQAAVGVERWLDLGEGELLLCEGDEDLDRLLLAGGVGESEQVKSYSGRLGWGSATVGESVVNFVKAFAALRQRGEERKFAFTTTAELQPSRRGFDALGRWEDPTARPEVIAAIRARLVKAAVDELDWLDADPGRWDELVEAVTWRFGAPDLDEIQGGIESRLEQEWAEKGPADLLAARLLAEALHAHVQDAVGLRVLTRHRLLEVLAESRERLDAWAAGAERFNLDTVRKGIRDELRAHDLEVERAALEAVLHSGSESLPKGVPPAALLRAGAQVVSFVGRSDELSALDAWLELDAPAAVRVFTGAAGTGKTRLLVEWVKRLRARGVRAGFLKKEVPALDPLFGALGPRVVIVDYAENRLAEVRSIVQRLAEDERGQHRPFRLVLLARGLGEWWEELGKDDFKSGTLLAVSGHAALLAPLVPELAERRPLYDLALQELQGAVQSATPPAPAPALDGDHFAEGLYVLMAALAAIEGKTIAEADDLLDATLDHERRYWRGSSTDLDLTGAMQKAFVRSLELGVFGLTLWSGRPDDQGVRELVRRMARLPANQPHLIDELVEVLLRFYGRKGRGARGLEPDLLGEHLVQRVLERDGHAVLQALVAEAGESEAISLLTVLDRIARRRAESVEWLHSALQLDVAKLAMPAIEVALATGDPIGSVLASVLEEVRPLGLAESIVDLVDNRHQQTVVLLEVAVAATNIVLEARRADGIASPEAVAQIARLASNFGVRLAALGRLESALGAAQEATELYRRLAKQSPDAFLPHLGLSLNRLGNRLSDLGRRELALETAHEATELYRKLAEQRSDAFLPDLGMSLSNLGTRLSNLGRKEPGLEATWEAAKIYRKLAEQRPHAFLPYLASILNNLGNRLSDLGRRESALEAAQEAKERYRRLSEQRPDAFLPDLAMSLNNLGNRLGDLGRWESALEATQEANALYRSLSEQRPDAFLPGLATSLHNLGNRLSDLGRRELALEAAQEATKLLRKLAEQRPDAFLPKLAISLHNIGTICNDDGDQRRARQYYLDAVTALSPVFLRSPSALADDMKSLLGDYLRTCEETGETPDAEPIGPILEALESLEPPSQGPTE